MYRYSRVGAQ